MQKNLRQSLHHIIASDFSKRKISRLTGYSRNTITRYQSIVRAEKITAVKLESMDDAELEKAFSSKKKYSTNFRAPDFNLVERRLKSTGVTRLQLWEEYVLIEPSTAYSYSQFNALFAVHMAKHDITMRQIHFGGETVHVDFAGKRPCWQDPETGEQNFVEIFVGVLACSNYIFACACPSQKLEDWIEAHIKMFEFFKGVPKEVVPDNLKAAVTTPGLIPTLNKTYVELANFYGFAINPARVRRPQDKGKGEQAVLFVTRWITSVLNRRTFFSIEEINEAIAPLLERINLRPFKRLPGNRQQHYEELDLPLLRGLPNQCFEFGDWVSTQKVDRDYHVRHQSQSYSVPYTLVGQKVELRVSNRMLEVFHLSKRVASHRLSDQSGAWTTLKSHMPETHRRYADRSYSFYLEWAQTVGLSVVNTVKSFFAGENELSHTACRQADQLQTLGKDYTVDALEAACKKAFTLRSVNVTTIHNILKRKTYESDDLGIVQQQLPLHENVRGADYFTVEAMRNA